MNTTKMLEILEKELRFVAKNPGARAEKTASEYAQRLVEFIDSCQADYFAINIQGSVDHEAKH